MNKIVVLLCLLIPLRGITQVLPEWTGTESDLEDLQVNLLNRNRTETGPEIESKGSPFLYDDFRKGDLYFSNNTSVMNMMIKYNCYTDEVCFLDKGALYAFEKGTVAMFVIRSVTDSTSVTFRSIAFGSGNKQCFLQVLYEGDLILYKRHHKEYSAEDVSGPYNADRRFNEYIDKPWYYLQKRDGSIHKLRLNEKYMARLCSPRSEEISRFININNIKLTEEKELVKLVYYYDELTR